MRGQLPQEVRCRWCGAAISVQQARLYENTCNHWRCRQALRKEWAQKKAELQERERQVRQQRAEAAWAGCVSESGRPGSSLDPDPIPVPLLANVSPLMPLPELRREAFRRNLREAIVQTFQARLESGASAAGPVAAVPPDAGSELPLLQAACGVCQGRCCHCGGDHAYVSPETILRYLALYPDATPEEVFRAYDSCLADETVEDSCVLHQSQGCGLPRAWRSATCNCFECTQRRDLHRIALAATGPTTYFLVALDNGQPVRTALVHSGVASPEPLSPAADASSAVPYPVENA